MPDVHARLSASGAKRWLACPPSVTLEAQFADESSEFAAEGTFAHSLAELILRYNNGEISKPAFTRRFNKLKEDQYYSKELQDYIEDYVQRIWEIVNETKSQCPDAQVLFEQRLDFSEYVPEGFGTGDVVIVADEMVNIIDLKYGKGVGVSAEDNPQLRLYGLGAYLEHSILYDIQKVKMTIIQPRLENISTEEISVEALLEWAEAVKPRAEMAMKGEGDFLVGDHCRFCKARKTCRARAEQNLELAKYEFADPSLLTPEEIGDILGRSDELAHWVKDITDYALEEALKGTKFTGWKLVEGMSKRKYGDPDKVIHILTNAGYKTDDVQKPAEPKGLTDMTKLLGKKIFEELLSGLVIKPEGKPTLVPLSDKRPELSTADSAKADFSDDEVSEDYEECLSSLMILEAIPPHNPVSHYIETMGNKFSEAVIRKAYKRVTEQDNI